MAAPDIRQLIALTLFAARGRAVKDVDGNYAHGQVHKVRLVEADETSHYQQDHCQRNCTLRPHVFGLVALLGERVVDLAREVLFLFSDLDCLLKFTR